MLVIGDVEDTRSTPVDSITNRVPRMAQQRRSDTKRRVKLQIISGDEITEFGMCTELSIHVGHEWCLPTAKQCARNAVGRGKMTAPESKSCPSVEHGREE